MMIESSRIKLRPFLLKDIDVFITYRNNESWMIYQDFKGYNKEEYAKMIIDDIPDIKQGLQIAIVDITTDELLGDLYLKQENEICWLGYTIHPKHARKGYIYEAVLSVIPLLKNQGVTRLNACAHPQNTASINLIKKLEFTFSHIDEIGDTCYSLNI